MKNRWPYPVSVVVSSFFPVFLLFFTFVQVPASYAQTCSVVCGQNCSALTASAVPANATGVTTSCASPDGGTCNSSVITDFVCNAGFFRSGNVCNPGCGNLCSALTSVVVPANATGVQTNCSQTAIGPCNDMSLTTSWVCNAGYHTNGTGDGCELDVGANCIAQTTGGCNLNLTTSGGTSGTCDGPTYVGTCQYSCSNGTWTQVSNLCSMAGDPCAATTINNCNVGPSFYAEFSGTCASGYSGTCRYRCDGLDVWSFVNNTCVPGSCVLPWGGSIASGSSVTAYSASTVACGNLCSSVSQTRTCTNGVLSGTYTNQSCSVLPCGSCTLPWGGTIPSGNSVTAYAASSVPCGSSCSSQTRTCTNGVLSGTYTNQACSVQSCSCSLPWGGTIASGSSVTAYAAPSVACGSSCSSQTRTCTNGTLSGTYTNQACSVATCNCSLPWGGTLANGSSVTAYSASSVACGNLCSSVSQTRTCTNAVLSGTYTNQSCSVLPCGSCALPWGGSIASGANVTAYAAASVPCGSSCSSQTRTCTNGVLSGTYTNQACSVQACSCTLPWGGTIASGTSVTAWASPTVACGSSCSSQTRTCTNGSLSGTYTNSSCAVQSCNCSLPWGGSIATGTSVTAYAAASVPCGSSCSSQTRTCTNTVLSGTYTNQSCSATACLSCNLPWGGTIAHNASVTAYSVPSVACGVTCASVSQTRTCNNGTLSGTYTNPGCGVAPCSCNLPWGGTIANGASVTAYSASSVACGSLCSSVSQTRTCTNGTLSGTYTNQNCSVAACACNLPWGGSIASGASVTAYSASSVACGSLCSSVSQTRTCTNGTLSGTYTNQNCSVAACPCNLPWGGTIASGSSVTAYAASSVACGSTCTSQTRTCTNGTLSGTYANQNCSVAGCVCSGTTPANSALCTGDDTGLTGPTTRTPVNSCTATKCEYLCNPGYQASGTTCVKKSWSIVQTVDTVTIRFGDDTWDSGESKCDGLTRIDDPLCYNNNQYNPGCPYGCNNASLQISNTACGGDCCKDTSGTFNSWHSRKQWICADRDWVTLYFDDPCVVSSYNTYKNGRVDANGQCVAYYADCPSTTQDGCVLDTTSSGNTATGYCESTYTACSFYCYNGYWSVTTPCQTCTVWQCNGGSWQNQYYSCGTDCNANDYGYYYSGQTICISDPYVNATCSY